MTTADLLQKEVMTMSTMRTSAMLSVAYTRRGCGTNVSYPERFSKCPVCGIKGG